MAKNRDEIEVEENDNFFSYSFMFYYQIPNHLGTFIEIHSNSNTAFQIF